MLVSGKDGRTHIKQTTLPSYRIHGQLRMEFSNENKCVGSGTLISPHHVLTAGHNIYSHKVNEGWATSVKFIPAQDEGNHPYGEAEAAVLLSVENWTINQSKDYDFGMVILDTPIGYKTGWAGLFVAPDCFLQNYTVHVTGYPKGEKNKRATQMWTMGDRIKTILPNQLIYDIDTTPGQSGSGVWTHLEGKSGFYVLGVHAYGQETANEATRISPVKFKRLIKWMSAYQLQDFVHPELPSPEKRDEKTIFTGYKRLSKEGNAVYQYGLGDCYAKGWGVRQNDGRAFEWYEKAAKQNYILAKIALAKCYINGQGCLKNIDKGLCILHVLADQNDAEAQFTLGNYYQIEIKKICEDYYKSRQDNILSKGKEAYNTSLQWYTKAANNNHPFSQLKLAQLYEKGCRMYYVKDVEFVETTYYTIIKEDISKAIEWYTKAADQGNAEARYTLGWLCQNGYKWWRNQEKMLPLNHEEAKKWYRLAAADGHKKAEEALKWYELTALDKLALYDASNGVKLKVSILVLVGIIFLAHPN